MNNLANTGIMNSNLISSSPQLSGNVLPASSRSSVYNTQESTPLFDIVGTFSGHGVPIAQASLNNRSMRTPALTSSSIRFEGLVSTGHQSTPANLTLRQGREAETLLHTLRANPKKPISIRYENSAGQDDGGLSRQAFDSAYNQLLNKESGLFIKEMNEFTLNSKANPQAARDFGLILGRIADLNSGVGHDLNEHFFNQLHGALTFINQRGGSVPELVQGASKEQLIQLLSAVDRETYGTDAARAGLNSMDLEDVREYACDSTSQYLEIAQGFKGAYSESIGSAQALMDKVCGPVDLKLAFSKMRFEVVSPLPASKTNFIKKLFTLGKYNLTKEDKVENWFHKTVAEANESELKAMSRFITGGSYFNPEQNPVIIKLTGNSPSNAVFGAHTCFNILDVDTTSFMKMIKQNQHELLKADLMNAGPQGFNQA